MRRRITANFLKAFLLVALLAALAGGVGWLIGQERSAALFAFCALSAAIAVYWLGERALLGMLGSDKETDVFAHFFGFAVGFGLGAPVGASGVEVRRFPAQLALGVTAMAAVAFSWWLAGAPHFPHLAQPAR